MAAIEAAPTPAMPASLGDAPPLLLPPPPPLCCQLPLPPLLLLLPSPLLVLLLKKDGLSSSSEYKSTAAVWHCTHQQRAWREAGGGL